MDLEVRIKAFLEGNGITLTDTQLQQLNATLKDTTTSSRQGAAPALAELGGEGKALTESMRNTTRASFEFGEVLRGMERGGLGGAMEAMRGLRGLFRTLGPEMVAASGIMAPAIAVVAVAVVELNRRAKENQQEMQRIWTGSADRAREYKAAVDAIDKAAEKFAQDFTADLDAINERMKANIELTEEATKHYDELRAAGKERATAEAELAEKTELANPNLTPEQRQAIKDKYASGKAETQLGSEANELINRGLNAKLTIQKADQDIAAASETARAAQLQIDEAKRAADEKISNAAAAHEAGDTPERVLALQNEAKEARHQYEELSTKLAPDLNKAAEVIATAEKSKESARTAMEGIPDRAAAIEARAKAGVLDEDEQRRKGAEQLSGKVASDAAEVAALQKQLDESSAARLSSGRLTTPGEFAANDKLQQSLDAAIAAHQRDNNAFADYTYQTTRLHNAHEKMVTKLANQAKNLRMTYAPGQ